MILSLTTLKIAILIVFLMMLISLGRGLYFLISHKEIDPNQKLLSSLTARVILAVVLIALIGYGYLNDILHDQAPW